MKIPRPIHLLLLLGMLVFAAPGAEAQKTDVLVLRNGDRITGEVRGLTRGLLTYKTDDAGTLQVEWDKVASLRSIHTFEVDLVTQRKLFGTFSEGPQPGTIIISGELFPIIAVVSITQIKPTFIERTAGYVDLGWTLAKAHRAHTTTFGADARYRGELFEVKTKLSAYQQGQEDTEVTRNASAGLNVSRFIGTRWAAGVFGEASMDDVTGLELRTFLGTGAQRRVVQNNHLDASVSAGLVGSRERYREGDNSTKSLEVLVAADFAAFRLDSPKLDAGANLKTFTSLTESNRIRTELDTRIRYEVFGDFFIQLSLKASYDTNPPSVENPVKSSYNSGLSVGWSW